MPLIRLIGVRQSGLPDKEVRLMSSAWGPGSANEQELIRLMDTYGSILLSLCRMMLHDFHRAQDAVQETFIKAYRHINKIEHVQNEKAWLIRIAVNICRDMMRTAWFRHAAKSVDLAELPELPAPQERTEDSPILDEVQRLPAKEREVILLHYWQEMDADEIASALSINRATVYRRLERARQRLKMNVEGGLRND